MAAQPWLAPAEREDEPVVVREGVTVADYLSMPETTRPHNLIEGRLYMSPAPVSRHQDIVGELFARLRELAKATGGRAFVAPMDCHLPDGSVLQPDVLYVAPKRVNIVERWVMGAPDLVVEVLSPGTRRFDRSKKMTAYGRNGVREAWLVDPDSLTVIVFTNDGGQWVREQSVLFGDAIPSDVVSVGSAGLEEYA